MKKIITLGIVLFPFWLVAQSIYTIEEFKKASDFYTVFNAGNGNVSQVITTNDFISGESLSLTYSFQNGNNSFFTVFKNFTTNTQDYSYQNKQFSLQHKGGNSNLKIAIRLWEDINMNGAFDGEDEVFTSQKVNLGSTNWVNSVFDINDFVKVTGNGNNILDLQRIRAWDVQVINSNGQATSGNVLIDQLQLHSNYTPPTNGNAQLSGSFIQLWNTTGCSCGLWTQQQWDDEMEKMKAVCMNKLVIQYSVYDYLTWYSSSNLNFVTQKYSALDKIVKAAEKHQIKIHFGLYFDEKWNTSNKSLNSTYNDLLIKHKAVIDELWTNFGESTAFGGWYIPQELNDLEWQTTAKQTLLFNWLKEVSDYAHTKSNHPVMIAPFFNLWQPADVIGKWYDDLLATATNLDAIYPQDGVSLNFKEVNYHIPLYLSEIKKACNKHGKTMGATIETFHQLTGWPIDNQTFSATSANINRVKQQLWNVDEIKVNDMIQFSWGYMLSKSQLYSDYKNYTNCTVTNLKKLEKLPYLKVTANEIVLDKVYSQINLYNATGQKVREIINSNVINTSTLKGIYFIQTKSFSEKIHID